MLVDELHDGHYFAKALGRVCSEGPRGVAPAAERQLERRVGKGYLWSAAAEDWTEEDLCDFIEVFHDVGGSPGKRRIPRRRL